jgi:hypothetical protein
MVTTLKINDTVPSALPKYWNETNLMHEESFCFYLYYILLCIVFM